MNVIASYAPTGAARDAAPRWRRWLRRHTLPARAAVLAAAGALFLAPLAVPAAPAVAALAPGVRSAARPALTDQLLAVSCPARRRCIAVGIANFDHQAMLAERWTGRRWSVMHLAQPAGATGGGLTGVSCTSARACTAVGFDFNPATGSGPVAERWNGRRWHIQATPTVGSGGVPFAGVSCASRTSCTAVGYYDFGSLGFTSRTLVEHWDGSGWAVQTTPQIGDPGSDLTSVSCPSQSTCTAAGYSIEQSDEGPDTAPLAMRWHAATWAIQPTPADAGGNVFSGLNGVSCPAATACIAVGSTVDDSPLALRWNGTKWHSQAVRGELTEPGLNGVSCSSAHACTAVGGEFSSGFAERWNGRRWALQHIRHPGGARGISLTAVSCSSARRCTAVGSYSTSGGIVTLAERWNGRRWVVQPTRSPAP